jgi:hypothetical protein
LFDGKVMQEFYKTGFDGVFYDGKHLYHYIRTPIGTVGIRHKAKNTEMTTVVVIYKEAEETIKKA